VKYVEARISPRDIGVILNKVIEQKKSEGSKEQRDDAEKNQEQQYLSLAAQAYKFFSDRKTPLEVANALNLGQPEITKLYREYWKLKRLHRLYSAYTELGDKGIGDFLKLYRLMKEKEVSNEQVANYVDIAIHKFPYMESLYAQTKDQAEKMQHTRQGLANDIEERKKKKSLLDNIIFSSEQECKRTEQQLQELRDKKDRLEKLLANLFLANHRYTRDEATLQ
jgi:hypothetical protein